MTETYQIGNYENTYRTFNLEVPERFNWAYQTFDKWAEDPEKIAMVWVSHEGVRKDITFKEFGNRSRRVSNALTSLGAQAGDSIFIMLPRLAEWWEIMLGCIRGLFVSVPGTTLLTTKDISYRIKMSEAKIAITDSENLSKLESVKEECPNLKHVIVVGETSKENNYEKLIEAASPRLPNPHNLSDAPLVLYFTSGTTGYPKMVMNTHSTYPIGHIATGKFWLDNRPTDIHWTISDTGWAQAAWSHFFGPWNMGAALFVWDHRDRFDASATLNMLETYPITTFFAPPTAYRMLVLQNLASFNPMALRHCTGAGEPVNPEVIDAWMSGTGHHIWEAYGQTETTLCIATFPGTEYRAGSMGVAAPGFYVAVVDQDGNELPPETEGEIAIRTHPDRPVGLLPGYWKNPTANASCFRGNWYYTGDRATRDKDGYFWFVGRADDVIISASYRIGPFEVESALIEHNAVAEAAVVGRADPIRNNIVKAFVVLAPGYQPSPALVSELQDHVKKVTAPYKYPREIEFIDELPKTISGKILRNALRNRDLHQATKDNAL